MSLRPSSTIRLIASLVLLALTSTAAAQSVQLTPAQQQMLNQLPASQRAQVLQAIEQSRGSQAQNVGSPAQEGASVPALSPVRRADPVANVQRASAGSRIVMTSTPKSLLTPAEVGEIDVDPLLSRIRGNRNFVLDENGVLSLYGVQSISLLGLTETDIERRLAAEPLLAPFDIDVRILASQPTGVQALRPFGYEIFESNEASFDPPMTGPVPPDYVLGPGDTIRVQLFGSTNGIYDFVVTRDGILNVPEIGPVTVAGLPFSEFRADVNRRVQQTLIGTQVSVTMGQLRTIRIFVLGDVNRPGSYVVSSLATISSALYRSGGISRIGSLRNIQLKRSGNVVAQLDLYDFLLQGDTSGDSRLQPGDVIFVPPIGAQVSVSGAVRRAAIYETGDQDTVADVVRLAGGLLPDAYPDGARIERVIVGQERVVIDVDADGDVAATTRTRPGDALTIPKVLPDLQRTVTLVGHVQRPGPYQWRAGMQLADLIPTALDLKPGADADYVLIRREDALTRRVHVLSAKLGEAWASPGLPENLELHARDTVHVFSLTFGRERVIAPIMDELRLQARLGEPYYEVRIVGQVKASGVYPLEPGMRISDLIRAGGNLSERAYTLDAELTRYAVIDDENRATDVIDIDLDAILRGVESADLILAAHDHLRISSIPMWNSEWSVTFGGEVIFPGEYRIRRGETLRQVLDRAGGLTDEAFADGAIFLRESLRQKEQEQINLLAGRLESDLAALSLQTADTGGAETMSTGRVLLDQLRSTDAVGRLVIDLDQLATRAPTEELVDDIELRDGDRLLVPTQSQVVTVIGEVQQSTSHLHQPGLSREDYLEMSGGLTRHADKKLIYVVRASGTVLTGNRSKWFGRRSSFEMRPGDTIVAPMDTDRIRPLTFWTNVTQILYQGAIAVAAIKTFSD